MCYEKKEFEIIQKILNKSVRNLSNSEIDILVKICPGNTSSVPITTDPPSPPQPQPILIHSPHQSAPPRPDISLAELLDAKKLLRNVVKKKSKMN